MLAANAFARRVWRTWVSHVDEGKQLERTQTVADSHFKKVLQRRFLYVWRNKLLDLRVQSVKKRQRMQRLKRAVALWKAKAAELRRLRVLRGVSLEWAGDRRARLVFDSWKRVVAHSKTERVLMGRAERMYRSKLRQRVFDIWMQRYHSRVYEQRLLEMAAVLRSKLLLRRWMRFAEEKRTRWVEFLASKRFRYFGLLSRCLTQWRIALQGIQSQKEALDAVGQPLVRKRLRKALGEWYLFAAERKQKQTMDAAALAFWRRSALKNGIRAWTRHTEMRVRDDMNRALSLHFWSNRLLQSGISSWRVLVDRQHVRQKAEDVKVRSTIAQLDTSKKRRLLSVWRTATTDSLHERLLEMKGTRHWRWKAARRAVSTWRRWATVSFSLHARGRAVHQSIKHHRLQLMWETWRQRFKDASISRAKERLALKAWGLNLQTNRFFQWRSYTAARRREREKDRVVMDDRRRALRKQAVTLWLAGSGFVRRERLKIAQETQSELSRRAMGVAYRIARHWRYKTLARLRLSRPPTPLLSQHRGGFLLRHLSNSVRWLDAPSSSPQPHHHRSSSSFRSPPRRSALPGVLPPETALLLHEMEAALGRSSSRKQPRGIPSNWARLLPDTNGFCDGEEEVVGGEWDAGHPQSASAPLSPSSSSYTSSSSSSSSGCSESESHSSSSSTSTSPCPSSTSSHVVAEKAVLDIDLKRQQQRVNVRVKEVEEELKRIGERRREHVRCESLLARLTDELNDRIADEENSSRGANTALSEAETDKQVLLLNEVVGEVQRFREEEPFLLARIRQLASTLSELKSQL